MPRPVLPADHALAEDAARRSHLEALEDLDPVADLDGTVQVLLDAGVRLLGVDGIGLMLANTKGCCAPPADPTSRPRPSCAPRSTPSRARACTPSCGAAGPGGRPGRRRPLAAAEAYAAALAALLELAAEAQRSSGLSRRLQDLVQGQAVVERAKGR